jgi:WD40 repeat protein
MNVRRVAWSADGRLLAASCDDRNVHVWDTEQGKPQAILEGHQKAVWEVAFSRFPKGADFRKALMTGGPQTAYVPEQDGGIGV